jgi:hypothetical protein
MVRTRANLVWDHGTYSNLYMLNLREADIVFTQSGSFIGKAIRFFERRFGEGPSLVNHVGLMVNPVCIVEALAKVICRDVRAAYRGKTIAIYRPLNIDVETHYLIAIEATNFVGRTYGYIKIVAHALDWFIGGWFVFRRLARMEQYPMCSWLVAHAYSKAGYNFGVKPDAAEPDDIWDYVTSNPDKYKCIWPLSKLGEYE